MRNNPVLKPTHYCDKGTTKLFKTKNNLLNILCWNRLRIAKSCCGIWMKDAARLQ